MQLRRQSAHELAAGLTTQQRLDRFAHFQVLIQHAVYCFADRHLHPALQGDAMHFACRVHTLRHVSQFVENGGKRLALCQQHTDLTVA